MDILSWVLVIFILILSLPCGYLLGWIAKEEMKGLERILFFVFRFVLAGFGITLVLLFYFFSTFLLFLSLSCVFILGILKGSFYYLQE